MAVRVRSDGRIFCAALHPEEPGDTYIPDQLHYDRSVVEKVLVTQPNEEHMKNGEWWWRGSIPIGVEIDPWYFENKGS